MPPRRNNDKYHQHPLSEDFPISTLGDYRKNIIAPNGPFDCCGNWTQVFGIHSTGAGSSRVGKLTLTRRVRSDGSVSIRVQHEKLLTGSANPRKAAGAKPRRVLEAVMQIDDGDGLLCAPRQWSFRTQVFDAGGGAIPEVSLDRRAAVKDGKLQVSTGSDAVKTYPLSGSYTVCWALFDAVSRLPREPFDPIRFTLIDHFDQVKPQQTLVFRRSLDASIADRTVRLYAFDQTGRGIMPWTYFVDEQGRLVVAISGLETYMLESATA